GGDLKTVSGVFCRRCIERCRFSDRKVQAGRRPVVGGAKSPDV
ncbi:MAG: hypothetical protein AVDCRST_MAG01-01-459, partial [uncultured Rubrobacteraceae bacterium]